MSGPTNRKAQPSPPSASCEVPLASFRDKPGAPVRFVAEETPVALSYNRLTHAVMMATPADLEDFAYGFSRSEQIITGPEDIEDLDIITGPRGVELRMWVPAQRLAALEARRRQSAGPTGCGLCGLESLEQAIRQPPPVGQALRVSVEDVRTAIAALYPAQTLNQQTRAVHAAAFWTVAEGLCAVREDVGRHNALDKLSGSLARAGIDGGSGILVMTSRVSVELVQKAAILGAEILVAVSAPTALALRVADQAGMTIAGIARNDGFDVFTHPHRIRPQGS